MKKQTVYALIQLLRPHQWIKNSFVFIGIIFGHQWHNPILLQVILLTFTAFCLVSSCAYVFNDLMDVEADRQHPIKQKRVIASKLISKTLALIIMMVLASTGVFLGFLASFHVATILIVYLTLNLSYSRWLKHIVILDVFCIAASFMLRIFAGTYGVGIPPSYWLVLCGLMLTLFLGFAKRRAELAIELPNSYSHRKVLEHYTYSLLDKFISVTAGSVILTYALYTISPETIFVQHSTSLIYTVPFVIYGMFRYLYLIHFHGNGHDTAHDLFHDWHLIITVSLWVITTAVIIIN